MNYSVEVSAKFKRHAKRLLKKFPSLKQELDILVNSLETDPKQGVFLGLDCYKIRLIIASKGKGKSVGARVITHVHVTKTTVYLLTIYDKSEQSNITDSEIKELLSFIL
jgi:mRNA-degrading endonuclease RelE of RelBE toxin-antitoxin system